MTLSLARLMSVACTRWTAAVVAVAAASLVTTVLVAGSAGLAAITGAFGGDKPSQAPGNQDAHPAPATTETQPAEVILRDCWMELPATTVSLTDAQAQLLTTRAAKASATNRGRANLADTVARTLDQPPAVSAAIAHALLGHGRQRLTCSFFRNDVDPEGMLRSGLTPRAHRLRRAFTNVFGYLPAGGFARGGVSSGHVDNSAHYEGRAMDVFFRPLGDKEQRRRGWVFAQWLVAHAHKYDVLSVIYADHIWTSWGSFLGWRDYVHPSGDSHNPVLRHLDHIHVAVESGRPWRGYER
jgi:hypothetical protein